MESEKREMRNGRWEACNKTYKMESGNFSPDVRASFARPIKTTPIYRVILNGTLLAVPAKNLKFSNLLWLSLTHYKSK
jgi:hypothetical protein